ncbi:MAG TPA: hypothetical protein VMB49_14310 [Acidobacteriaceae bacterium]|nr:hypothetical protein [Acidobacteriaceae bacterium]
MISRQASLSLAGAVRGRYLPLERIHPSIRYQTSWYDDEFALPSSGKLRSKRQRC